MKKNLFELTFCQLFLLLIPITINIYLLRTISLDIYGKLIFFQAIFNFLSVLINSGLSNDSLRDLSKHIKNSNFSIKLNEYINAKLFYMILSLIICIFIGFFAKFNETLFYVSFLYLLYFFFDFTIFYQVINRLKLNLLILIFSYLSTVICLFSFVKEDTDILIVPLISTLPYIILNLVILIYIFKKRSLYFKLDFLLLIFKLKSNMKYMISNLISSIITKGIYIFIGIFLDMKSVAIYSVLDQIVRAPLIFINRISSLFTPKLVNVYNKYGLNQMQLLFIKYFMYVFFLSLFIILILSLLESLLLPFLLKENYQENIKHLYFSILIIIPLISLSSLCALQYFVNLHKESILFKFSIYFLLVGFPFIVLNMYVYELKGLVFSYIFVEVLAFIYYLKKLDFNLLKVLYENKFR
ncbi:oligosaccharide flippase family protein [Malaciobacter marinus]|uniref:oligosaccharide flippase family protein n=1 Tax=Malaciobacter marinus TaxID=505249 RepID=UPI003B00AAF2